jgi:hypothetical protein
MTSYNVATQLPAAIVTVALYNVSIANAQANMEEVSWQT